MRLRPSELAPPLTGELELGEWPGTASFGRVVRVAQFWTRPSLGAPREAPLKPIFEPQILRLEATHLVLAGFELHGQEGRVREFQQVWRCAWSA